MQNPVPSLTLVSDIIHTNHTRRSNTYSDLRVTVNGIEYQSRGGQIINGVISVFSQNEIINDLLLQINNDPAQHGITASLNGFGIRITVTNQSVFSVSVNTSDTSEYDYSLIAPRAQLTGSIPAGVSTSAYQWQSGTG